MTSRLAPLARATPLSAPAAATPLCNLMAAMTLGATRNASILASLRGAPGSSHNLKRVGRGPSSGHGRTSGRGMNGQKVHGKVKSWFQGGQTPLIISRGTKGFDNKRAERLSTVNLDALQHWIDTGRIDPSKVITPKELIESGLVGSIKDGIKLLARNKETFRTPITVIVSRASAQAIESIEAAGGKVTTRYFTRDSIRNLVKGKSEISDKPLPVGPEHVEAALQDAKRRPWLKRLPDPTHRWDVEYYRDPAHRGYLSHMLKEGESPSLFFGVPKAVAPKRQKKASAAKAKVEKDDKLF